MSDMKKNAEAGWKVIGSKGKVLGMVGQVREDHLVVTSGRLIKHTYYIPVSHVASAADGQVTLTVQASTADAEGWQFPPGAGYKHAKASYPEVPETTTMQAAGMSSGTMSAPEAQGAFMDGQMDVGEAPNTQLGRELNRPVYEDEDDKKD